MSSNANDSSTVQHSHIPDVKESDCDVELDKRMQNFWADEEATRLILCINHNEQLKKTYRVDP